MDYEMKLLRFNELEQFVITNIYFKYIMEGIGKLQCSEQLFPN